MKQKRKFEFIQIRVKDKLLETLITGTMRRHHRDIFYTQNFFFNFFKQKEMEVLKNRKFL